MSSSSDPYNHHWHFSDWSDKTFQLHGRSLAVALLFFSLLLFSTLLFICFFYVCTQRRRSATVRSTSNPGSTATHMVELGLDPATINALPIFLHGAADSSSGLQVECSICISMFQEGERVKVLPPCRHAFHSQCVDKWLMTHSSCPLCRTAIRRGDSSVGAGLTV